MLEFGNNVFIENYVKGIKLKTYEGQVKIYFSDRTAKVFPDSWEATRLLDAALEYGFLPIDSDYINPYLIKGIENMRDGRVKVYFPDTTATTLYLDDDGFEELKMYLKDLED